MLEILEEAYPEPVRGGDIAARLGLSRQTIVKIIAVLRSRGEKILATPRGYVLDRGEMVEEIIAVKHGEFDIEEEISIIVEEGCIVADVIVEHPVYGELRGILDIRSKGDLTRFLARMRSFGAKPLLTLSEGIHLHTIRGLNRENIENVKRRLRERGFLLELV
ncbi:MAG: transcription repressor NadR [Synergistetes bacterium]|nr:transcription repressor NadR [Synergistota bacterium]MDW8191743.1 transcription repressor NadR [Synergistota bacterium]